MLLPCLFNPDVYRTLLPRPKIATEAWAEQHVPAPSIIRGQLRFDLFPFMREVIACLDSPDYDRVSLMFAARCGKTTTVQAWVMKELATNPHPVAWGEPDAPSCHRVFKRWREKMLVGCQPLLDKMGRCSNSKLNFSDCMVQGAWSGSPATAADEAFYIVVLNERAKYSHRRRLDREGEEAGEAEFGSLLADRTIGWPGASVIEMSTPTIKGRCRMEASYLSGDRRRYQVPCPHCGRYQQLKTGRTRDEVGGIKFDKGRDGRLDVETARATAHYECEHCREAIHDEHRYDMINRGRWVRDGQSVDRLGRVRGTPLRGGRHASFQLSTLCSLLPAISWGEIAATYVGELKNPLTRNLQNYTNSVEGETFDPTPPQTTSHELAERLASPWPRGQIPDPVRFLTLGVDTGVSGTDLLFYWMLCGWYLGGSGHVIDWGATVGDDELWKVHSRMLGYKLPHVTGIDSGGGRDDAGDAVTERVYEICRNRRRVWPVKGSAAWASTDWYKLGFQQAGQTPREIRRKKNAGLGDLIMMATPVTQSFRENLCYGRITPGDSGFVTLPAEVAQTPELYADFLDELVADVFVNGSWRRRGPNEYGDTLRICRTLAEMHTRGGKLWDRLPDVRQPARQEPHDTKTTTGGRFSLLGGGERPSLRPR
jgi:phage terminase large subunit GpA-like protein